MAGVLGCGWSFAADTADLQGRPGVSIGAGLPLAPTSHRQPGHPDPQRGFHPSFPLGGIQFVRNAELGSQASQGRRPSGSDIRPASGMDAQGAQTPESHAFGVFRSLVRHALTLRRVTAGSCCGILRESRSGIQRVSCPATPIRGQSRSPVSRGRPLFVLPRRLRRRLACRCA